MKRRNIKCKPKTVFFFWKVETHNWKQIDIYFKDRKIGDWGGHGPRIKRTFRKTWVKEQCIKCKTTRKRLEDATQITRMYSY